MTQEQKQWIPLQEEEEEDVGEVRMQVLVNQEEVEEEAEVVEALELVELEWVNHSNSTFTPNIYKYTVFTLQCNGCVVWS